MRKLFFCTALSLAAALAAGSTVARAASQISFCNNTGSKVYVAVAFLDAKTQKWTLSAWHTAPAGGCGQPMNLRTGLFYYFAEKEGRKIHWPAEAHVDKTFCVPSTKVKREMTGGTCASGERNLGFRGTVPTEGNYKVTLN